jgi:hypothetical protein
MPVEKRGDASSGNIMAEAFKKANVATPEPSPKQPETSAASSASSAQVETSAVERPQPAIRQRQAQQREAVVEQSSHVKKDSINMSQTDFSQGRRDQGKDAKNFNTLNDMGAKRLRPLSRSAGSVRAKELATAIEKELNAGLNKDGVSSWAVQILDAGQLNLPTSSVVLLQTVTAESIDHITMYSFMIDGADIRLTPRVDKVDGRPYETPVVIGDIYNSQDYITRAEELIKQARPTRQINLIDAGATVFPASFNIEQHGVWDLLYKATLALFNTMNNQVDLGEEPAYTLAGRNAGNEQLVGRLNFSGEKYIDEVGHPQRHDVVIEMDSVRHQQGRDFSGNSSNVTKVAGYMEPVYAQPDPQNPANNQPFLNQFVITQLATGYDAIETEMTILALVTSTMVQVRNGWADAYLPRYANQGKELNYRDVGALGFCMGDAKRIDTKAASFKDNFGQFMRDYFRLNQGVIFSMDIPEVGPDAFITDIFRAAAGGNPNAVAAITQACDNLTGGVYSQKVAQYGGNFPMFIDTGNRIHNGYYVNEAGELRDIRDIDMLAVANVLGKTNPQALVDYADSYVASTGQAAVRMSKRLAIIDDVLQGRQVITGFSGRYIIGPKWLQVISEACQACNLVVNPANMVHGLGSGAVLGGYDYAAFAAGGAGGGVFNGGGNSNPQSAYAGRGRW